MIKEHLTLPGVQCRQHQCEGIEDNAIHKIGKYYGKGPSIIYVINLHERGVQKSEDKRTSCISNKGGGGLKKNVKLVMEFMDGS